MSRPSAPPRPPKPTRLKVTDDKGFEKVVLIDKDVFIIGSDPGNELVLPCDEGSAIAPRHAVVMRDGEGYLLKDESGSCGTRVNGRPIRRTLLRHGDQISLGRSSLKVQFLVEGTRASDREEDRVRALLAVLRDLHSALEEREVAARAAAGMLRLLGPGWAVVGLLGAGGRLEMAAALDRTGSLPSTPTPVAQDVARSARGYFHPAHLCVPLADAGGGRPLGVVDVGPRDAGPYKASDLQLLEALAEHVGIALANARRLQVGAALARSPTPY